MPWHHPSCGRWPQSSPASDLAVLPTRRGRSPAAHAESRTERLCQPSQDLATGAIVLIGRPHRRKVVRQRQGAAAGAEARALDVLTEIATRFYLGEESQIEIARDLGLDPSTVSRHLKRAREEGIVHIEIRAPLRADVDLGREVASR